VAVTQSETGVVRRMAKQQSLEMLQQCLSVSTCMKMLIFMEKHDTVSQHSMPYVPG
jgi:hypothetical protein